MGCVGIEVPAVDDTELGEFLFGGRRVARGTAGERDGDAVVVRGLVVVVMVVVMIVSVSVSVSVADLPVAGLVDGVGPRSVRDPRSGDFANVVLVHEIGGSPLVRAVVPAIHTRHHVEIC